MSPHGRPARPVGVGGLDRKPERHRPVLDAGGDREPGVTEHIEHGGVLGQGVRLEDLDATLPGGAGQFVEQQRTDPVVLVLVGDHERHLGLGLPGHAVEAAHGDQAVAGRGHQGQAVDVVHRREALDLALRQRRVEREEPQVDRMGRQELVEGDEARRVVGPNRPDVIAQAPGASDVAFEVVRVVGRKHRATRPRRPLTGRA